MLLWGLFALLYCCAVPGLAVVVGLGVTGSAWTLLVLAVGLSLLINHLTVLALTFAGIYVPAVVVPLTVAVTIVAAGLVGARVRKETASVSAASPPSGEEVFSIAAVLVTAAVLYHVERAAHDFGTVFVEWDSVVSWNRWAVEWTQNAGPVRSGDYPQLVPTVWSMSYLLTGTSDIQVFAKAIVAWLVVAGVLVYAAIWRESRDTVGIVGAIIFTVLIYPRRSFSISGYVEIPTAMMALFAYFAGWLSLRRVGRDAFVLALIGAALAAGAASTKQGGFYYAVFYPLFLYFLVPDRSVARRTALAAASVVLLVALCGNSPRLISLLQRTDGSVALFLATEYHGNLTFAQKVWRPLVLIYTQWMGLERLIPLGVLWLFALRSLLGRVLLLGCVVPPLMIYILFFGYDLRNGLFCLPFLAWAAAVGWQNSFAVWLQPTSDGLASRWNDALARAPRLQMPSWTPLQQVTASLAAMLALVALSAAIEARGWPSDRFLAEHQTRKLRTIGYKAFTSVLLDWIEKDNVKGPLLSNYTILAHIPLTKPMYVQMSNSTSIADVDKDIEQVRPQYIIDINGPEAQPGFELAKRAAEGKLTLLRDVNGSRIYAFNPRR